MMRSDRGGSLGQGIGILAGLMRGPPWKHKHCKTGNASYLGPMLSGRIFAPEVLVD